MEVKKVSVGNFGKTALILAVALVIAANVLPIGFTSWYAINTTEMAWGGVEDTKTTGLLELMPFFIMLVLIVAAVRVVIGGL